MNPMVLVTEEKWFNDLTAYMTTCAVHVQLLVLSCGGRHALSIECTDWNLENLRSDQVAWTEFEYNIFVHETRSTTVECGDRDQLIQIGLGNMHALTGMQIETEKLDHESLPGSRFGSGQRRR